MTYALTIWHALYLYVDDKIKDLKVSYLSLRFVATRIIEHLCTHNNETKNDFPIIVHRVSQRKWYSR